MSAQYAVTVDQENAAEQFWETLRARPDAAKLERAIDAGVVTPRQRQVLESIPGFAGGPAHAPTALIFETPAKWSLTIEGEGEQPWSFVGSLDDARKAAERYIADGDYDGDSVTVRYYLRTDYGRHAWHTFEVEVQS